MPAIPAPYPENETARIDALNAYEILDTPYEKSFDELTWLAAQICGTPISIISLLDTERQWFKSAYGLDAKETPRDWAFCSHTILKQELLVVENTLIDPRFSDNPLVVGEPGIRFYAGYPLETAHGLRVGTLCVIDRKVRTLNAFQTLALQTISRQVTAQLELRKTVRELQKLASTDSLTGLWNIRAFQARLHEECRRTSRTGSPISVVMVDIDNFKQYNDDFGHPEGDTALKTVAHILKTTVRTTDFVARYGGEEFILILPDTNSIGATVLSERLRIAIEGWNWPKKSITASFGAATLSLICNEPDLLIADADRALYRSKRNGRNSVNHIAAVP